MTEQGFPAAAGSATLAASPFSCTGETVAREEQSLSANRIEAIDVARAVTIIGVVFNHTILGFVSAGLIAETSIIADVNAALYIFRMPALVLIAGLFIPGGVRKYGTEAYIRRRLVLLIYLYLLWFYIQTPMEIATSSLKNHPKDASTLLTLWWPPAHLWFLPFLALATAFVAAATAIVRPGLRAAVSIALAGAGILLWSFAPDVIGVRGFALILFLALGAAIGLARMGGWLCQRVMFHIVVLTLSAALFAVLFLSFPLEPATLDRRAPLHIRGLSAVAAAFGVAGLLSVAALLARSGGLATFLARLGSRYTLEIYLAHIIVVAGLRIVATRMGFDHAAPLAVACVVAGVFVPVALAEILKRAGIGWLFDAPPALKRFAALKPKAAPEATVAAPARKV